MSKWEIPNWGEPWEPEFEVPYLKELATKIVDIDNSLVCEPDFETKGCAFLQLYRKTLNVGRICVTRNENGAPFYSGYFGENEDEFHGFNQHAVASVSIHYLTEMPDK